MITTDLNELKRLAELALNDGHYWFDVMGLEALGFDDIDAPYMNAANPATILALIERIQEAETRNALQQRALDSIRNEALEEAAEICETAPDYLQDSSFDGAARAIRALKSATSDKGDL